MFFTQRKLEGRIRELGEYRYRDVRNFESFLAKEDKTSPYRNGNSTQKSIYRSCDARNIISCNRITNRIGNRKPRH